MVLINYYNIELGSFLLDIKYGFTLLMYWKGILNINRYFIKK